MALQKRYRCNLPDPYAGILSESDSLLLSRAQIEALQGAQARFRTRADSLWLDLGRYLAALGDDFDGTAAFKRQEAATDSAWVMMQRDVQENAAKILTPIQIRLAPWPASMALTATKPITGIRMFMAGTCNR